jgi:Flp pilus assembly protein CpaB
MFQLPMTLRQIAARFPGVNTEEIMTAPNTIIGRFLRKSIRRGDPFLTTNLYLEGSRPDIAKSLQPGFLAVRVLVPLTREVDLQPGNFVDVFFRANPRKSQEGEPAIPEKTIKLLHHVEVLETARPPARSRAAAGGPERMSVLVTLAVPKQKADFFSIVEGRGEVWLLPTPAHEEAGAAEAVPNASTLAQLLGIQPPLPWRAPPPFETVIYRRTQMQINRFVDDKLVSSGSQLPRILENAPASATHASPSKPQKEEE